MFKDRDVTGKTIVSCDEGELITHRAIASARQAGVFDLRLNSVYAEKPQLSLKGLRASQVGTAAL